MVWLISPWYLGSVVEFDNKDSVVGKVGSAIDLCMGGVSVFAVEQDNLDNDLTNAIWDVGALAPTAEDIVACASSAPQKGALTDQRIHSIWRVFSDW